MSSILKVDTIQNTGGTTGLTIDSSGRVTRPVIPAWRVGLASSLVFSGVTQNALTTVQWTSSSDSARDRFIQGGCSLSSGKITVPVTGLYQMSSTVRFDNVGSGYALLQIYKNDDTDSTYGSYSIDGTPDTNYLSITTDILLNLNANETVRTTFKLNIDTSFQINSRSYFQGFLIG